jgi:hypothetical protein
MKTLKMGNEVIRKSDNEAHKMVRDGNWKYCPKSEFKKGKVSKPVKVVKTPDKDATLEVLETPKTGYKGSKSGRGNKEAKDAYRAKKKGRVIDVKPAG